MPTIQKAFSESFSEDLSFWSKVFSDHCVYFARFNNLNNLILNTKATWINLICEDNKTSSRIFSEADVTLEVVPLAVADGFHGWSQHQIKTNHTFKPRWSRWKRFWLQGKQVTTLNLAQTNCRRLVRDKKLALVAAAEQVKGWYEKYLEKFLFT